MTAAGSKHLFSRGYRMRSGLDLSSKRDNRRPQRTKYRSSRNNEAKGFTAQPIVECRRLVHFENRPHGQTPTSVLGPATTTTLRRWCSYELLSPWHPSYLSGVSNTKWNAMECEERQRRKKMAARCKSVFWMGGVRIYLILHRTTDRQSNIR